MGPRTHLAIGAFAGLLVGAWLMVPFASDSDWWLEQVNKARADTFGKVLSDTPPKPLAIPWNADVPPKKYQGDAQIIVEFVDVAKVVERCKHPDSKGCTTFADDTDGTERALRMVVANPCAFPAEKYARIICHELGHIHKWDHENDPCYPLPEEYGSWEQCTVVQKYAAEGYELVGTFTEKPDGSLGEFTRAEDKSP